MKVGIVLPTVSGRERVFDRVYSAFEATCPDGWEFDVSVPEGYQTVGEAWNAGAPDVEDADYLLLAIDDAEPHPGWVQAAAQTVDAGYIPAPRFEFADGSLECCGSMGFGALLPESPDCTPCRNAPIIFVNPQWWRDLGPLPPWHYSVDDFFCWKAALHGHPLIYRSGMRFTHHHERAATEHVRRLAQTHISACLAEMARIEHPAKTVRTMAHSSGTVAA